MTVIFPSEELRASTWQGPGHRSGVKEFFVLFCFLIGDVLLPNPGVKGWGLLGQFDPCVSPSLPHQLPDVWQAQASTKEGGK